MEQEFTPITPIRKMSLSMLDGATDKALTVEGGASFQGAFKEILRAAEQAEQVASQDSSRLSVGNADDLAAIQINALKAQAAIQTTVQITSRAINAYKEIMQMQL